MPVIPRLPGDRLGRGFSTTPLILTMSSVINAYDPIIKNLEGVNICKDMQTCIGESDIVVTATEWKDFANIPIKMLEGKTVLDFRRILDPEKYNIKMGVGLGKN